MLNEAEEKNPYNRLTVDVKRAKLDPLLRAICEKRADGYSYYIDPDTSDDTVVKMMNTVYFQQMGTRPDGQFKVATKKTVRKRREKIIGPTPPRPMPAALRKWRDQQKDQLATPPWQTTEARHEPPKVDEPPKMVHEPPKVVHQVVKLDALRQELAPIMEQLRSLDARINALTGAIVAANQPMMLLPGAVATPNSGDPYDDGNNG